MSAAVLPKEVVRHLHDLFTRFHIGAATYVFESEPYAVDGDEAVLARLQAVLDEDRVHARLLAHLITSHGLVPEAGVFPYWHRDLNYLTVPYMANFVVESLEEDLRQIDLAAAATPDDLRTVHVTLRSVREEREALLEMLRPIAAEATMREAEAYKAASDAVRTTREERLAREKAAEAAARKAAQDAKKAEAAKAQAPTADLSGMPDPNEEGISSKEKAKRTMLLKRAQKAAAAAPASAGDPTAGLPDPNEEGISPKEKAKRTMMIKRAQKAAAAAPQPAADPAAGLPDPNEEGISSKEKAKRTMMIRRAKKKAETAEGAESAEKKPAGGGAQDIASMPDPDEPGISPKERAKRTMMIKRAQKKAEET